MERARAWFEAHPLAIDLGLLLVVLVAAGALRLALLGEVPYGLHPDEAQVGTDAARILDGHPIGPYTEAALGQPSGHAYLATPFVALLGHEVLAVRLPLALVALATVPLLYAFARITLGRAEAFFASLLLATSYWHLLYSRVAHWSISYGAVALAIAICLVLGLQRRSRAWLIAAGACAGVGAYTYNIYAIVVVALAVAVTIITIVHVPRAERRWWLRSLAWSALTAAIVALPMIVVVATPGSTFWDHAAGYGDSGLLRSDEFREASLAEKVQLAAGQAKRFAATYTYDATLDLVDGNGLRPVFDPLSLALLGLGALFAWRRRTNPAIIIAVCCVAIIPLPAVLQRGSVMRQPVAAAPFAALLMALPLAWAWRGRPHIAAAADTADWKSERADSDAIRPPPSGLRPPVRPPASGFSPPALRLVLRAGVVAVVAAITAITVHDYFWTWRNSETVRFVYHAEVTSAARYIGGLPDGTYVYFYSDRHPLRLETIGFLAPDVEGVDRSERWARADGGSIEPIRRDVPVAFVLLEPYLSRGLLARIEERYPGGHIVTGLRDGRLEYAAYELPANPDAAAPIAPP